MVFLQILHTKFTKRLLVIAGGSLAIVAVAAVGSLVILHRADASVSAGQITRTKQSHKIADIIALRPQATLVGSSHELQTLKPSLGNSRRTFPLNACPSVNDQVVKKLQKQSIAVLVHLRNQAGPRQCTLEQIVQAYGRPNASTTIIGTLTNPRVVLLYFDKGPGASGPIKPVSPAKAPATVVPTSLATLPPPVCATRTILSTVAHQDDDILFMNPDHQQAIRRGECLRTVFLTAGDAALSRPYWLEREKGAEAAYDAMMGRGPSLWLERYVQVNNHEYIKMASPRGNTNITLIFVNLPDGNVPGTGFVRNKYESLAKLNNGAIPAMHTVDGQSTYNKAELTDLLVRLMQYYHPSEIDTQTPIDAPPTAIDHSDHKTTGIFTTAAHGAYGQGALIKYYTGYPIATQPQNVTGQDLSDKTAAFNAYVPHDKLVCLNPVDCAPNGPYQSWNMRQYNYTPGQPLFPVAAPAPAPAASPAPATQPQSATPSSSTPPKSDFSPPKSASPNN